MASEQAAVSSAITPVFPAGSLSESATVPIVPDSDTQSSRTKPLKRSRPDQSPANLTPLANAGLGPPPISKSPRFKGAFSPAPLTGAAALADERRKKEESERTTSGAMSENPNHKALSSLMAGGGAGMSKAQDAPAATSAMSEGMSTVASAITIPTSMLPQEKLETSPASVTSLASLASTAQTATASPTVVASPSAMDGLSDSGSRDGRSGVSNLKAPEEQSSNRALSFPGNVLAQPDPSRMPARGLSLPMPGHTQQLAPRSPSQKKHKCPYCETEFTRHHNLKSHLLTHSQEKPYVCQTCQMRFRRLHDLKRHMKLHTGERPHICPKCDRKFARGDALARHSKGQGGCAGRRASMGSFGGDDDYEGSQAGDGDDNGMEGVMYTNGAPPPNEAEMTEEERRRFSLPAIKAQHVGANQGSQENYTSHSRTPSTYPPVGPRPGQPAGLYPPNNDRGPSSSSGTSPSMQNSVVGGHTPGGSLSSMALSTGGGSMFSQSGMTESPKPLSPAGMHSHQLGHESINRQRSPSLTTQFQQQHFGRRQSGRASPTNMSLPSPHGPPQGPKLPAISNLAPPDQRYTLPTQTPGQQNPGNGSQGPSGANSPSAVFQPPPRHHQQGSGSGDSTSNNVFAGGERGVWAYCQTLEERVKQTGEELNRVQTENKMLQDQSKNLQDQNKALQNQNLSHQDQLKRQAEEINFLRTQLNAQSQSQQAPVAAHS